MFFNVETQYLRLPHANSNLICGSVQLETQVLRLYGLNKLSKSCLFKNH